MSRIVVLGDLNLDIHARIPSTLGPGDESRDAVLVQPGGSAGTFARTAARLGVSVTFIGAVGNDLVGNLLEDSLAQAGVTPKLRRCELPSGAVLAIQQGNERSMVCSRGANDGLTEEWVSAAFPERVDHLHISGYAFLAKAQRRAASRALLMAAALRLSVSVDPPPASLIRSFGVESFLGLLPEGVWVFPNLTEGQLLGACLDTQEVVSALAGRFPVGALTLGPDGATAWSGSQRHHQESEPLPDVDTTGAGDVFAATFVTELLRSNNLEQANAAACQEAAAMLRERLAS